MPPRRPMLPVAGRQADPFDLWLSRSLHERWDSALDEELPRDLLRLACDSRAQWDELKERWKKGHGPGPWSVG
ncbi:hypothetical protein SAMN02745194_03658 [Roseomonas rosea]|jgi:hypothetical protein|uniref:Uncharacterized protein n=1 Tax=Muricoccus roseus TaxID=198092 RepID=A0A1M6N156_9PROT|nr:hypothetical protein [Roseomonas rosea]SHJ89440.1 hypothetical protein SAMN02745194_03658 [Roseomonas rosea]